MVGQAAREEQQLETLTQILDESREALVGQTADEMRLRQLELMAVQRAMAESVHRASQDAIRAVDAHLRR